MLNWRISDWSTLFIQWRCIVFVRLSVTSSNFLCRCILISTPINTAIILTWARFYTEIMLKVIVHNAESVPNLERFTNIDPLVALIFQGTFALCGFPFLSIDKLRFAGLGTTKQTNWQRSTCDPKWEEVLSRSASRFESQKRIFNSVSFISFFVRKDFGVSIKQCPDKVRRRFNSSSERSWNLREQQVSFSLDRWFIVQDEQKHFDFRLIGQGLVNLADVIRVNTIKRRAVQLSNPQGVLLEAVSHSIVSFRTRIESNCLESLFQTKLYLTLDYSAPKNSGKDSSRSNKGFRRSSQSIDRSAISLLGADLHLGKENHESNHSGQSSVDLLFKQRNSSRSKKSQDFQVSWKRLSWKTFELFLFDGEDPREDLSSPTARRK